VARERRADLATTPTEDPLVAARLQSLTQLLPGPDRFGDEFLAGTGAYTGSRAGHKADGTAPHHGGGSPLAPGGAPLMIALGAQKLLQIIMGAGQSGDAVTMQQAWPVAAAALQHVPHSGCQGADVGLMRPQRPQPSLSPPLHGGLSALALLVQEVRGAMHPHQRPHARRATAQQSRPTRAARSSPGASEPWVRPPFLRL
jgi:hypothetical protein